MKKFLIFLVTIFLTASTAFAADVSRLYKIKDAKTDNLEKILTPYLKRLYPNAILKNNCYILEDTNKKYFYVVILSQKDDTSYFYYMSNNEEEDLRKSLLKTLKNNDFKPKKVFDSSLKSFFYGEAYTNLAHSNVNVNLRAKQTNQDIVQTQQNPQPVDAKSINYDFSDEAQARFDGNYQQPQGGIVKLNQTAKQEAPIELNPNVVRLPQIGAPPNTNLPYNAPVYSQRQTQNYQNSGNVLSGSVVYIQDGATFTAMLLSDISSDSLVNNDRISAELDADWIYNGYLIAPAGSILNGRAIETRRAGFAMANGQIGLLFDEIMTPDGNVIPLKTNKVYITGNSTRALNITKRIAGGAATGLLLSAISMLLGADPTSAIIAGTSIGAGAGAISAISAKGEEINLIEGSQLQIMLIEPLTVQIYRQ